MILLISGTTHSGKTLLAQKLLEHYHFPCLSLDLLKMGLIRSKNTNLTVEDDELLTTYLWNIVKEMIKTALENKQNLIIEGCYLPFDWKKDFTEEELKEIHFFCLVMTKHYIEQSFSLIQQYANVIEQRISDFDFTKQQLIKEHERNLNLCYTYQNTPIIIDDCYDIDAILHQVISRIEHS